LSFGRTVPNGDDGEYTGAWPGRQKWKSWFTTEGKLDLAVDQTSNSVLAIFVLDSAVDSRHGLRPVVLQ
jgi:hypothetical protein